MRKKKNEKNSKERNEKVETKMKFRIDFQPPFLAKLINESRNQKPAQWNGYARELNEYEGWGI